MASAATTVTTTRRGTQVGQPNADQHGSRARRSKFTPDILGHFDRQFVRFRRSIRACANPTRRRGFKCRMRRNHHR